MDYDDWSQRADELLARLDAKYGAIPKSPPEIVCNQLRIKVNRLLEFLEERSADAWETRKLSDLLECVETLARDTTPDESAIDQLDLEYFEIITSDDRVFEADRLLADLDTLDALSHALKSLEEKKNSGPWTAQDDANYATAVEFCNSIIKKLRESNVPFDDRAS